MFCTLPAPSAPRNGSNRTHLLGMFPNPCTATRHTNRKPAQTERAVHMSKVYLDSYGPLGASPQVTRTKVAISLQNYTIRPTREEQLLMHSDYKLVR